jgi:hypothetical protein
MMMAFGKLSRISTDHEYFVSLVHGVFAITVLPVCVHYPVHRTERSFTQFAEIRNIFSPVTSQINEILQRF